jgi:rhodanese-related sulfurtransferase
MRTFLGTFIALMVAACSGAPPSGDAGTPDSGAGDAGPADAGPADAGASDAGPATLGFITASELHTALLAKDFLLIDVHTPREGVVPGTDTSIPFSDVNAIAAYIGADLNKKVVLTCLSSGMSDSAGSALAARGYRAVRHLQGGMNAWVAAGYTLDP